MPYDSNRHSRFPRDNYEAPRVTQETALRDLLVSLRDTFRDAASRIDRYLGTAEPTREIPRDMPRESMWPRGGMTGHPDRPYSRFPPPNPDEFAYAQTGPSDPSVRITLEALREEARQISADAPTLEPAELRLRIEAVTAETRSLQNRAGDPEDRDIAAKILRVLTAIVSEHRPGHVYGLARHHQADWDELGRKARADLASGAYRNNPSPTTPPSDEPPSQDE